jgi:hypothetical protein
VKRLDTASSKNSAFAEFFLQAFSSLHMLVINAPFTPGLLVFGRLLNTADGNNSGNRSSGGFHAYVI